MSSLPRDPTIGEDQHLEERQRALAQRREMRRLRDRALNFQEYCDYCDEPLPADQRETWIWRGQWHYCDERCARAAWGDE